ncbi:hypothetical protein BpHYR1_041341, partial [Brachionus plicatilis]
TLLKLIYVKYCKFPSIYECYRKLLNQEHHFTTILRVIDLLVFAKNLRDKLIPTFKKLFTTKQQITTKHNFFVPNSKEK